MLRGGVGEPDHHPDPELLGQTFPWVNHKFSPSTDRTLLCGAHLGSKLTRRMTVPRRKTGEPKSKLARDNQDRRVRASLYPVFEKRGQHRCFPPTVFTADFVQGGPVPN